MYVYILYCRCGYVLQPDVMRAKDYSPFSKQCLQNVDPLTLHITVRYYLVYIKVLPICCLQYVLILYVLVLS